MQAKILHNLYTSLKRYTSSNLYSSLSIYTFLYLLSTAAQQPRCPRHQEKEWSKQKKFCGFYKFRYFYDFNKLMIFIIYISKSILCFLLGIVLLGVVILGSAATSSVEWSTPTKFFDEVLSELAIKVGIIYIGSYAPLFICIAGCVLIFCQVVGLGEAYEFRSIKY